MPCRVAHPTFSRFFLTAPAALLHRSVKLDALANRLEDKSDRLTAGPERTEIRAAARRLRRLSDLCAARAAALVG